MFHVHHIIKHDEWAPMPHIATRNKDEISADYI